MDGVNPVVVENADEETYEVGIDLGKSVITFTTPRKTNATRDVSQNVSKDTVSKTVSTVTNGAPLDAAGKCTPTDHAPMSSPETITPILDPPEEGSLIAVVENDAENESDSAPNDDPPGNLSTPNIINLNNVGSIDEWVREGKGNRIYIAREINNETQKYPGSIWGNPYRLCDYEYNREMVVDLFKSYILKNEELMKQVGGLNGKTLGCWCAPEHCHGVVLHELAGNLPQYEGDQDPVQEASGTIDNVATEDVCQGVGINAVVGRSDGEVPCIVDVCTQSVSNLCDTDNSPTPANLGTPVGIETDDVDDVLEVPFDISIPIVIHETPVKVSPTDGCNPFDLNVPIEEVMNSLGHHEAEEAAGVRDGAVAEPARSSSRPKRSLQNTIAELSDDEMNALENDVIPDVNSKETLITKTRSVIEDRDENLLHERSVEITRGKGLQLKVEQLSHGVYKKKSGFRTPRPIEWAIGLEDLLTDCRWDYMMNDSKYTECLIKIANAGGMINIDIKLTTGIVFVYGSSYEDWFDTFFESWRSLVVDGVRKPVDMPTPPIPQGTIPTDEDIRTDVDRLWLEHNSLKTAVTTLDSTVKNLTVELQGMVSAIQELKSSQEDSSRKSLSKTDEKLKVFLETASDECVGKISKCRLEITNELEKQKSLIIKQEARFQSVTDQLKNQIQNKTHSGDSQVKWIHLDNIRKSCCSSNENMDTQVQIIKERLETVSEKVESFTSCSTANDEMIPCLQQDVQAQKKRIDELDNSVKVLLQRGNSATTSVEASMVRPPPTYSNTSSVHTTAADSSPSTNLASKSITHSVSLGDPRVNALQSSDAQAYPPPPVHPSTRPAQMPPHSSLHRSDSQVGSENEQGGDVKLVVWMDSNGKHIKPELFWKQEGTIYERTYTIQDVNNALDKNRVKKIGCILISCGVNDIEDRSGREVANGLISLIGRIRQEHPETKIVLSEVTPYDARDREVRLCNGILHEELADANVRIVKLEPLRDAKWSKFRNDRKHVKVEHVKLFASLLIDSLKEAHGLPTRHQKHLTSSKHHQHKSPEPLMGKLIPMPPNQFKPNSQTTSIGQRLQNIAYGSDNTVDRKQNLISKLVEFVQCLEGW